MAKFAKLDKLVAAIEEEIPPHQMNGIRLAALARRVNLERLMTPAFDRQVGMIIVDLPEKTMTPTDGETMTWMGNPELGYCLDFVDVHLYRGPDKALYFRA